ncbi:RNA polymerase sigma factor [Streptomyces sp. NPDC093225]|uniref:RNA polymerase sigma factor n=1 Tax=Streptomyces sp. NPDC093225 TaxID=3366034 RepID=UPI00381F0E68
MPKRPARSRTAKPLAAVEAGGVDSGEEGRRGSGWAESEQAQLLAREAVRFLADEPAVLRGKTDGKLSWAACEDVVAQAVSNVIRRAAAGLLGDVVNLTAYLRRAAWNLARNQLKAQAREELAAETVESSAAPPAPPPDQVAVGDVDPMRDLLMRAIEAMPTSVRRQVVKHQIQGLTDIEIAAALGIRTDRLHRERHNALVELQHALGAFIRDAHRKSSGRRKRDR